MSDSDVPWLLLERHCAGACTPEEVAALESWIAGDPRRRLLLERLRTMFSDAPPTPDQVDIERAWSTLAAVLDAAPKRRFTNTALITTAVLALLGVAWLLVRYARH
jgi:ferric-dicitrate binding protein FerR (iron transport regulator)